MDCTALCTEVGPFTEAPQQGKPNLVAPVTTHAMDKHARTEEATTPTVEEVATSANIHVPTVPGHPIHVDDDSEDEQALEAGNVAQGEGIKYHKCSG
jgi:hypothetical protein